MKRHKYIWLSSALLAAFVLPLVWLTQRQGAVIRLNFYRELGAERSWDLEQKAIALFVRENPGYSPHLREQKDLFDHLRAVQEDYDGRGAKDLVFAPLGSAASDQFHLLGTQNDDSYFLMQVTASHDFVSRHKAVAVYPEDKNYLENLISILLAVSKRPPGKVHIFRNQWIPYLAKAESSFRGDLARAHLELGEVVVGPREILLSRLKELLQQRKIRPSDWILFLDLGANKFSSLENEEALGPVQKIFIYGPPKPEGKGPLFRNSTQVLFWHPGIKYYGSGQWSNCDFVREFRRFTGQDPEFHVAYLFASLEAGGKLKDGNVPFSAIGNIEVPTILGKIQWTADGRRKNNSRLFYHLDEKLQASLLTNDPQLRKCDSEPLEIRFIKN